MNYDIKLRPHHVTAFINFYKNKKFLLTDDEYFSQFKEKNKGYHNERFILYWKHYLENLYNNDNISFLYTNHYDEVCENCDIRKECDDKKTYLYGLVRKLDNKALKELPLVEGNIYTIEYLKTIFLEPA